MHSSLATNGPLLLQVLQHAGKPQVLATAWLHTAFLPAGGATTLSRTQLDKVAPGLPQGTTLTLRCDEAHPAAPGQDHPERTKDGGGAQGGGGPWGPGGWGWQGGGRGHRGGSGDDPALNQDLGRLGSWAAAPGTGRVHQQHVTGAGGASPALAPVEQQLELAPCGSASSPSRQQQAAAVPEQPTAATSAVFSVDSSGRHSGGSLTHLLAAITTRAPAFGSSTSTRSADGGLMHHSHSQPLPAVQVAGPSQPTSPFHPARLPSADTAWGGGRSEGTSLIELLPLRSVASAPASPAASRTELSDTADSSRFQAEVPAGAAAFESAAAEASSVSARSIWLGRHWGGSSSQGPPPGHSNSMVELSARDGPTRPRMDGAGGGARGRPTSSSSSWSAPCSPARQRGSRAVCVPPPAASTTAPGQQQEGCLGVGGGPVDEAALQQLLGALEGSWGQPRQARPPPRPAATSASSWSQGERPRRAQHLLMPRSRSSPGRAGGVRSMGRADEEETSPLAGWGSCYSDASSTHSEEGGSLVAPGPTASPSSTAQAAACVPAAGMRGGMRRCVTSSSCEWPRHGGLASLSEAAEQQQEGELEPLPPNTSSSSSRSPAAAAGGPVVAAPPRSSSASWWLSWLQQQQPGPQQQVLGGGAAGAGPGDPDHSAPALETAALLSMQGGCDVGGGGAPSCQECPLVVVASAPVSRPAKQGTALAAPALTAASAVAGSKDASRVSGAASDAGRGEVSHPGDTRSHAGGNTWSSLESSWQKRWWV